MQDNDLIKVFLPIITAGLTADGFEDVVVQQSNQPTQQGINTAATVYFFKMSNKRYGFLGRSNEWDSLNDIMVHTETQKVETTFQISALVLQDPNNPDQYTASDLVNEVASIMQSDQTLDILNQNEIGILRITDVSNGYFTDDMDNFEAVPSFNFTLVYYDTRVSEVPIIDEYDYGIFRI